MRQRRITSFTYIFRFHNIHVLRAAHVELQRVTHIRRPHWSTLHRDIFRGFIFVNSAHAGSAVGLDDLFGNAHGGN